MSLLHRPTCNGPGSLFIINQLLKGHGEPEGFIAENPKFPVGSGNRQHVNPCQSCELSVNQMRTDSMEGAGIKSSAKIKMGKDGDPDFRIPREGGKDSDACGQIIHHDGIGSCFDGSDSLI